MGYTGVVWESRTTEQLARDLTDGPGPAPIGEAGASWQRIANGFTAAADDYRLVLDRVRSAWDSAHSPEVVARLQELGEWLHAKALNAAANGQRAESAAVAATVAILAMPTVGEAVEAKAQHDMMASLAAYNGAILTGTFAEFDAAATADQANAAAVMAQYEAAVEPLATPWPEPPPPHVVNGSAQRAEQAAAGAGGAAAAAGGGGGVAVPPTPLGARTASDIRSTDREHQPRRVSYVSAAGTGVGGVPYAPFAPMARGMDGDREYESARPPTTLAGGGETGAGLSAQGPTWLPAAQINDAPAMVDSVSWAPDTGVFDGLADSGADATEVESPRTLEPLSDRWVSPAVLGGGSEDE
ncbi:PPE domain-containing protein [Mycobacterium sp. CPCC 205372]|uniref:PPE domain-containing protein n=1 Tax=Mycobacterium hippophais TaxID=3016340 RepID=A0ABT4PUG9_9MYCO|nr:PPE domain-containing protein [Mycobacterium hippophais]MCZ8380193.1 PPE domain-containing protein [Mycobacterium hippophais]